MKKVAVIIKHMFRSNDYRVDIYTIPEDATLDHLTSIVMRKMIGPFEIVSMTERIGTADLYGEMLAERESSDQIS